MQSPDFKHWQNRQDYAIIFFVKILSSMADKPGTIFKSSRLIFLTEFQKSTKKKKFCLLCVQTVRQLIF